MEFIKTQTGFSLFYRGRLMFSHSLEKPMIYLGRGSDTITMHHGNFDIKDEVIERLPFSAFKAEETAQGLHIRFYKDDEKACFLMNIRVEEGRLEISGECDCPQYNRLWLAMHAEPEEHVYGLGEQYSAFDLRGKNYPIFTMEQGVGRNKKTLNTFMADCQDGGGGDYWTTYFPQATFVSSRLYYLHLHGHDYAEINFSKEKEHSLHTWQNKIRLTLFAAETYQQILLDLTALMGRQPPLPDFMFTGILLGMQGGSEVCREKINRMLQADTAVSAV